MSESKFTRGQYVYVYRNGELIGAGQITGGCLPNIPYQVRMAGTVDYMAVEEADLELHPSQSWRAFIRRQA